MNNNQLVLNVDSNLTLVYKASSTTNNSSVMIYEIYEMHETKMSYFGTQYILIIKISVTPLIDETLRMT